MSTARPLREHGSAIYLLPEDGVIAKINRTDDDRQRASTAVAVARWLVAEQGFPATEPAAVDQPVVVDHLGATVTFWRYYPQGRQPAPTAGPLGALLARLHSLGNPPVSLRPYPPLYALGAVLERASTLPESDRTWLLERRAELIEQYISLDSPLGHGFIHGDAYPGNTVWGADNQVLLGDWDEVAQGPRELDLANTYQGGMRFGRTEGELREFSEAYGYDPTKWSGFAVLIAMRDLHTLASYIRLAEAGNESKRCELIHRISTLRAGDTSARWNIR
ncbi:phosphotransferase family protein [Longimycelium tulufanense]